ncbi:hypothetical protein SKAU_G00239630 [Synaphobranchus kaupii]|uniref:Uncharacterized protein n=1 Tax=Synaphobranchus kaupii TaxID=118154 RepID=A0A9Q1F781_SYNKA|nr:hypothetical protein SKAU_G00239630 [Synaphobranchus kaupii]
MTPQCMARPLGGRIGHPGHALHALGKPPCPSSGPSPAAVLRRGRRQGRLVCSVGGFRSRRGLAQLFSSARLIAQTSGKLTPVSAVSFPVSVLRPLLSLARKLPNRPERPLARAVSFRKRPDFLRRARCKDNVPASLKHFISTRTIERK